MLISCADNYTIPFSYQEINNPDLLLIAKNKLPATGILNKSPLSSYYYLKVDDAYIHTLFPLLPKEENLVIPDYFPPKTMVGAHISVFYSEEIDLSSDPDEDENENDESYIAELNQTFSFEVTQLIAVSAFGKTFYALVVSAPKLAALRQNYGFPTQLNYNGLLVPFHITIALQP